ncbi:MAG: zinc ribbon domain-containing protein [Thermodesulfobacteriota bacterium]|nr:zinc ribbon domain-containing protein [Thermodesulfobacteriota bacterium]
MPIYEYHCEKCGKTFEALVMGGKAPDACELCGAKKIKKLMSACGFHTRDKSGLTVKSSAGTSSCTGCAASSCGTCGSG